MLASKWPTSDNNKTSDRDRSDRQCIDAGASGNRERCKQSDFDRLEHRLLAFARGEKEEQCPGRVQDRRQQQKLGAAGIDHAGSVGGDVRSSLLVRKSGILCREQGQEIDMPIFCRTASVKGVAVPWLRLNVASGMAASDKYDARAEKFTGLRELGRDVLGVENGRVLVGMLVSPYPDFTRFWLLDHCPQRLGAPHVLGPILGQPTVLENWAGVISKSEAQSRCRRRGGSKSKPNS
jgi:hypothetical protein